MLGFPPSDLECSYPVLASMRILDFERLHPHALISFATQRHDITHVRKYAFNYLCRAMRLHMPDMRTQGNNQCLNKRSRSKLKIRSKIIKHQEKISSLNCHLNKVFQEALRTAISLGKLGSFKGPAVFMMSDAVDEECTRLHCNSQICAENS